MWTISNWIPLSFLKVQMKFGWSSDEVQIVNSSLKPVNPGQPFKQTDRSILGIPRDDRFKSCNCFKLSFFSSFWIFFLLLNVCFKCNICNQVQSIRLSPITSSSRKKAISSDLKLLYQNSFLIGIYLNKVWSSYWIWVQNLKPSDYGPFEISWKDI